MTTTTLNTRFNDQYTKYLSRVNKITDAKSKAEASSILELLADNVSAIEKAHNNALFGDKQALASTADHRENIARLRKQLEQRLTALKV